MCIILFVNYAFKKLKNKGTNLYVGIQKYKFIYNLIFGQFILKNIKKLKAGERESERD
jgi:hypothetical protein